jgi:hypothetical protein
LFIALRLYLLAAPTALFGVGAAMNQAAVIANGGAMPVQVNDYAAKNGFKVDEVGFMDSRHMRMTSETKFNFLGDYINLGDEVLSLGDLLLYLSFYLSRFSFVVWGSLIAGDLLRERRKG